MKFWNRITIFSTAAAVCLYLAYTKSKRQVREFDDDVKILTELDLIEIEKRFDKRRNHLRLKCKSIGHPVPEFDDIDQTLHWSSNQILHDTRKGSKYQEWLIFKFSVKIILLF